MNSVQMFILLGSVYPSAVSLVAGPNQISLEWWGRLGGTKQGRPQAQRRLKPSVKAQRATHHGLELLGYRLKV